jgi:hypothetical protein
MPSNYPPNVTGNEPHLTGEIEYDKHAPFWVGADPEDSGHFMVYWARDEDPWFTPDINGWTNEEHAQDFADKLNERFAQRFEVKGRHGFCLVCGDLHGEPK